MVQHVLIVAVAAPLLAAGNPRRGRIGDILAATAAYGAAIWLWHLPSLYQGALLARSVHIVQTAMLIGASLWFWRAVLRTRRDGGEAAGVAVLALFVR